MIRNVSAVVILLGALAMAVGTVALIKGSLKSIRIANRKSAAGVTAVGFAWLLAGALFLPATNDSPDTPNTGTSQSETVDAPAKQRAKLVLASNAWEVIDGDSVDIVGTSEPGAELRASWDGGSASSVADAAGAFRVHIGPLTTVGMTEVRVSAQADGKSTAIENTTVRRAISEANFKSSAQTIPYDQLKKDPDALSGTAVTYKAKIFQYDARTTTSNMLVSVTNKGYDFWTDNIFLRLDPALGANADESDLIQIWGTVVGAYSYETAVGGTNTIPEIAVEYLAVTRKQ